MPNERDEWLEMLQSQVGKPLTKVEKLEQTGDTYYRLWFGDHSFTWHASLRQAEAKDA